MTEKQIERVRVKIARLKQALAQDKKHWGGQHHDGGGIRYLIAGNYIQIHDYKGGLRYLNWFQKNFPDDIGSTLLTFEWALILYKCKKLKEAEEKIYRTFYLNSALLDIFLEKEASYWEDDLQTREREWLINHLPYKKNDPELIDFAVFVDSIVQSRKFIVKANEYIELTKQINDLPVGKKRSRLVTRQYDIMLGKNTDPS